MIKDEETPTAKLEKVKDGYLKQEIELRNKISSISLSEKEYAILGETLLRLEINLSLIYRCIVSSKLNDARDKLQSQLSNLKLNDVVRAQIVEQIETIKKLRMEIGKN